LAFSFAVWACPVEVENAILVHPGVADFPVIGIPDKKWREIVLAANIAKEGATLHSEEIKDVVRKRRSGTKVSKRIEHVSALP